MSTRGKVIITMPAYRAEATLEKTVADIPAAVADELILVDDASPDNTAELARSLGISVYVHPRNRGYGGNQKTCYTMALESGAEIVVMLHPDYQYEPKSVPLLIAPILAGEADMTFGSRFAGLSDPRAGGMPMYRFVGNRITTTIENLVLGSRFSEMHSGMRAYTRGCLLSLPFLRYSEDFGFDSQFMVDAVTTGQRVIEVPIPTRYTKESSSIGIARSLKYVAQSVVHAAARSAARGRRGRRYPVTRARVSHSGRTVARLSRTATVTPGATVDPSEVLEVVGSYFLAGRRVLAVDAGGAEVEVPLGPDWLAGGDGAGADVGLVTAPLDALGDPSRTLETVATAVEPGGIVALSGWDPDPAAVTTLLHDAGLTMIEWERLRRSASRSHGATVVIARRDEASA